MTKFKELFEANDETTIMDAMKKVSYVVDVEKVKGLGIVIELEGMSNNEWKNVKTKLIDLEKEGKIGGNWYYADMSKKDLEKYAETSYSDITPNIKDILKMRSIVRVYQK